MIREFTVGASHTVNLGNYESIKVEAQVVIDVPDGATDDDRVWTQMKADAQIQLRKLLEETYKAQSRKQPTMIASGPVAQEERKQR